MSIARHATRARGAASHMAAALLLAVAVATIPGCAGRAGTAGQPSTRPSTIAPPHAAPAGSLTELQHRLEATFNAPDVANANWGIVIRSLRTGDTIFEQNAAKLLVPASSMKVVTLAAAAERLGWDYRFETFLGTQAPIEDGIVRGDVVIRGTGDPSIVRGEGHWSPAFDALAEQLKSGGITRIDGDIVGDDNAFEDRGYGVNWAWDDFSFDYSAPIGALQYHENTVELRVSPSSAGERARVEPLDAAAGLAIANDVVTGAAGTPSNVDFERLPNQPGVHVVGRIAADAQPVTGLVAVDNPTLYFARALRAALKAHGIEVTGEARDIDDVAAASAAGTNPSRRTVAAPQTLASYRSPRLQEIGTRLMKVSQNLIAETFLKLLSVTPSPTAVESGDAARSAVATTDKGREALREMLVKEWGLDPNQFVVWDGSGLSRRDYLSAGLLVGVLMRMAQDPTHKEAFASTLPIGGRDGSLENRLKGSPAEGNVRAKTGSMSQVRSLTGYVDTAAGEPLAFSFIANGFTAASARVDAAMDAALDLLARFGRKTAP